MVGGSRGGAPLVPVTTRSDHLTLAIRGDEGDSGPGDQTPDLGDVGWKRIGLGRGLTEGFGRRRGEREEEFEVFAIGECVFEWRAFGLLGEVPSIGVDRDAGRLQFCPAARSAGESVEVFQEAVAEVDCGGGGNFGEEAAGFDSWFKT